MPATSLCNADAIQRKLSGGESVYQGVDLWHKKNFFFQVRHIAALVETSAVLLLDGWNWKLETRGQRDQRDQEDQRSKDLRGARNSTPIGILFTERLCWFIVYRNQRDLRLVSARRTASGLLRRAETPLSKHRDFPIFVFGVFIFIPWSHFLFSYFLFLKK